MCCYSYTYRYFVHLDSFFFFFNSDFTIKKKKKNEFLVDLLLLLLTLILYTCKWNDMIAGITGFRGHLTVPIRTHVIHVTYYLWTMRTLCVIYVYNPSRIRWPLYKTKAHHGPIEFTAAASRHCSGGNDGLIKNRGGRRNEQKSKRKTTNHPGRFLRPCAPYSAAMTRDW